MRKIKLNSMRFRLLAALASAALVLFGALPPSITGPPAAHAQIGGQFSTYILASATRGTFTGTVANKGLFNIQDAKATGAIAQLDWTAQAGTNPTLTMTIQDGPTSTGPWSTFISFPLQSAATGDLVQAATRAPFQYIRFVGTIGGTSTPTFTYSVALMAYSAPAVSVSTSTSGAASALPFTVGPTAFGSQAQFVVNEENLTLATGATTTNTTGNLLPANSLILSVDTNITTTITTAANWSVGDVNVSTRFSAANSTLTVGTNQVGINQWSGAVTTLNAGPSQAAAAKVVITTNANPGAGSIRISVKALVFSAPTS